MNVYLDVLVNLMVKAYFSDSRCLIVFTDSENSFDYKGSIPVINIKINSNSIHPEIFLNYFACKAILIKSNRPVMVFQEFEKKIRLSMERYNVRKFLIAPGSNMKENITDIFTSTSLQYVVDLIVIEPIYSDGSITTDDKETYKLWTHKYVGVNGHSEKELLDIWYSVNESFCFGKNLYPNKLMNQMGRILRMATFNYAPYSIIGSSLNEHKGSEMTSMMAFATYLNMTPELVINPQDYWGIIYENWTGNGLLGNLANDKADIGFAALYTWEVDYHYLDLSKPIIRTGITCLTPAPKMAAGWLTPLYSYSNVMWCFVASTFAVSILVHSCMFFVKSKATSDRETKKPLAANKTINKYPNSIFVIFKLFLVQLINKSEIPPAGHGKMFMGTMFVFSFFLSSTYSSGLATIMTIPSYVGAIETVEDFLNSGIFWAGTHTGWIDSIIQAEEVTYKILVDKFLPVPDEEELRKYSKTPHFAFALERLPGGNYAIGTHIKKDVIENFRLMKEDFYWEESLIMTRKSSVILPALNQFIYRIFEAGLISYWQNEAVALHMDTYVQAVVEYFRTNKERFTVKLKFHHVAGVFSILCFGYSISTIIFIFEIGTKYFRTSNISPE